MSYNPEIETAESDYPELRAALSSDTGFADTLSATCGAILKTDSYNAVIDSRRAVVSKAYAPQCLKGNDTFYYARIAAFTDTKGKVEGLPFIVFDETEDTKIDSNNPQAMKFFKDPVSGNAFLQVFNGIEFSDPLVNDPRYLKLAKDIIDRISEQTSEKLTPKEKGASHAKKAANSILNMLGKIKTYYTDPVGVSAAFTGNRIPLGRRRMKRALYSLIAVTIGWGPQIFDNSSDAKLLGIPLPNPIEALVDWNNSPDHVAQGFPEPDGAAPVLIGKRVEQIPLMVEYDTTDAPSSLYTTSKEGQTFHESSPGLYAISLSRKIAIKDDDESSGGSLLVKELDEGQCINVLGNYTAGKTSVFTQTPEVQKDVTVTAVDGQNLSVCLKPDLRKNNLSDSSKLFIYQKHDK